MDEQTDRWTNRQTDGGTTDVGTDRHGETLNFDSDNTKIQNMCNHDIFWPCTCNGIVLRPKDCCSSQRFNKKHIDASVKERPQTLLVPSEEICKHVLCNKHI